MSEDARHGTATVFIVQNGSDSAYFDACIRFADGKAVDHGFSIADPTDGTSWRVWDPNQSDKVIYSPASNPDDPCMVDFP
ncbi:hypothetical protein LK09_04155 [Microbacterium mangrovi]|uniref:Uncharacterized protein n=1 Tax=Microbacterium mangrovi TaxID=1348253 RepID=A0A0B2A959_9MICO|nr:hypothetical protein LK09_04155 [Microbacterium mangrovi]